MNSGSSLALSSLGSLSQYAKFCSSVRLGFGSIQFECITWFSISCPNSWPPSGLQATAGPYQQRGPYQQQGQSWNATKPNSTYFQPFMRSQQIQYPQFDFINPMTEPNYLAQQGWSYQACQQLSNLSQFWTLFSLPLR